MDLKNITCARSNDFPERAANMPQNRAAESVLADYSEYVGKIQGDDGTPPGFLTRQARRISFVDNIFSLKEAIDLDRQENDGSYSRTRYFAAKTSLTSVAGIMAGSAVAVGVTAIGATGFAVLGVGLVGAELASRALGNIFDSFSGC